MPTIQQDIPRQLILFTHDNNSEQLPHKYLD